MVDHKYTLYISKCPNFLTASFKGCSLKMPMNYSVYNASFSISDKLVRYIASQYVVAT